MRHFTDTKHNGGCWVSPQSWDARATVYRRFQKNRVWSYKILDKPYSSSPYQTVLGVVLFFLMIFEGCFCSTAFLCMCVSLLHRTCWGRCSHRSLRGPRIAWPWPADFDFSADGEVLKFYILCKSVTSYCTTRVWRLSSPSVACSQVFSLHASALLSLTHLKPRVLTGFFWLMRRNTAQMALGSNSATISPVRVQFKKDVVLFIRL